MLANSSSFFILLRKCKRTSTIAVFDEKPGNGVIVKARDASMCRDSTIRKRVMAENEDHDTEKKLFYTDLPIENREGDQYSRVSFSEAIGNVFLSADLGDSICVGLMGAWGSGKTSIINMVQEYIESEERDPRIKVMRFDPWNFTTSDQLINQFFVQLAEHFGIEEEGKGAIGNFIQKYASKIELSSISSLLFKSIPLVGEFASGLVALAAEKAGESVENKEFVNKSVQKQKKELQDALQHSLEKILIVIDDIDRLTDDQIRSVFQLVSIVCKFPNINYLLSFDRTVVAKALDKIQDGKGNEFIDKVVQVPINIPQITRNIVSSMLKKYIDQLQEEHERLALDSRKWNYLSNVCVLYLIKTPRDILRLYNGIKSKLVLISDDIDFADIIVLTAIEQHEPQLYEWIKRHKQLLINGKTNEFLNDYRYQSTSPGIVETEPELVINARRKRLDDEIRAILCNPSVYSSYLALQTLYIIFPRFTRVVEETRWNDDSDEDLRRKNCVAHLKKFDRYFSYNIGLNMIQKAELEHILREAKEQELAEYLCNNSVASVELLKEMLVYADTIDDKRAIDLIKALVDLGDYYVVNGIDGSISNQVTDEEISLIERLLSRIDNDVSFLLLCGRVKTMTNNDLDLISGIIKRIGVDAGEGEERKSEDQDRFVISKEKMEEIKKAYFEVAMHIIQEPELRKIINKKHFIEYIIEYPKLTNALEEKILGDMESLLLFITSLMAEFNGSSGNYYGFSAFDAMRMDSKKILEVLQEKIVKGGSLASLREEQQKAIIAFILCYGNEEMAGQRVRRDKVRKKMRELARVAGQVIP